MPTSPAEGNKPPDRGQKEKKESAKNVLREMKLSYDCGLPLMGGRAGSNAFHISLSFHGPAQTWSHDPAVSVFMVRPWSSVSPASMLTVSLVSE